LPEKRDRKKKEVKRKYDKNKIFVRKFKTYPAPAPDKEISKRKEAEVILSTKAKEAGE
jgi:hypothetical protein